MSTKHTQALIDIAAERARQIEAEGWTAEHDDQYTDGSLAKAAATYAFASAAHQADRAVMDEFGDGKGTPSSIMRLWPWELRWWKPRNRRRDLVKAGALILAEIERLDRAKAEGR